ncbi:MAG: hypothetical protein KKB21_05765, partial [Nanoarchaeota archaeon]|nr:hypothetical protein [Nanoarchaeota archaeon]
MKSEPIFIKSDNPVDFEKEMFEDDNLSDEIIFKSVSEVQDEELGLNNIVLFGSSKTNNLINEIYKKMPVAVIYERVEEVNHHYPMMTIKMADSPWNENKKVVIVEYNRKNDDIIFIKGKIQFEKRGNYYHISINDNNKSYAIVWNEYGDYYGLDNILQYDGKDVEIKGYIRIADSYEIKPEESIGFLGLKEIE